MPNATKISRQMIAIFSASSFERFHFTAYLNTLPKSIHKKFAASFAEIACLLAE